MGDFFAASAFRDAPVPAVAAAITRYAEAHEVACTAQSGHPANESSDVMLYEPEGGWTVVIWPVYFNIHDVPACAAVSKELRCRAVTVNVYDGDFWSFEFFEAGNLIDRAAPRADYFAEDDDGAATLREQWRGDPEQVAATFGVPVDPLRPYYAYLGHEDTPGKAHPDDQFSREDFWVFVDLWRRLGITYPVDPEAFVARLRLAKVFGRKLPTWEGEPL